MKTNGTGSAGAEQRRLEEDARREKNWKRWGPYLSERQWGTVREDYSEWGNCWDYFPHDHARSRAYRWGEDGLLGLCDREGRLCFALGLWNGRDPILKERLFGLTGPEGNHGEDVKEQYFYLDSSPTHSWLKALYKYPQTEYPYARLVEENRRRGKDQPEFELLDAGAFEGSRYFDVFAEYAKGSPDDVLIRVTVANRGPQTATVHLLPQIWFRNTWSWGARHDGSRQKPRMTAAEGNAVEAWHESLGSYRFTAEEAEVRSGGGASSRAGFEWLFTENETNTARLFGTPNATPFVKDAFHEAVVHGRREAVHPGKTGTKAAAWYRLEIPPGGEATVRLRLTADAERPPKPFGGDFDGIFVRRAAETDEFYDARMPAGATAEERRVMRQGWAGLLWSKQFYNYIVEDWLEGDAAQPPPPAARRHGRNAEWRHMFSRDVLSMPDKWEYPWFAAWDLAFHMIPFAQVDPQFAKDQLVLFLREWYMHPNGQIPAYEFAFGDVNPPVHAWAAWRVYKMTGRRGQRDRLFLERTFQKLLINFTWWVNRKDAEGKNLFSGGFLGLDNIGVFDRSKPLPTGGMLEQADGTAWMAFYCATMLAMALELAREDPAYEDMASKFFEHFVRICDAMNSLGGTGLWDEEDGFYYDQLHMDGRHTPLKIRSMVGLIPLFACELLESETIEKLPGFSRRLAWFLENRKDLSRHISYMEGGRAGHGHRMLAIPSKERLTRVLRYLLDENEFLSPYGIRSISRVHKDRPFVFPVDGQEYRVDYVPGESTSGLFGGNSNWRGPIWFPVNYLLVEALERYHHFYGDDFKVECPTGSGRLMTLKQAASEIARRLGSLFVMGKDGRRPFTGEATVFDTDPHWRDLVLFNEYFHGDTGRGIGASHQTGWTALAVRCIGDSVRSRTHAAHTPPRAEEAAGRTRTPAAVAARSGSSHSTGAAGDEGPPFRFGSRVR